MRCGRSCLPGRRSNRWRSCCWTPRSFSVFWNTCLLAFAQIAGQLVVAAPASWAFAKLRFAGRRFLLLGYIALMVLPFQVLMVPNYLIATRLGIYDTPLSVILPGGFRRSRFLS